MASSQKNPFSHLPPDVQKQIQAEIDKQVSAKVKDLQKQYEDKLAISMKDMMKQKMGSKL